MGKSDIQVRGRPGSSTTSFSSGSMVGLCCEEQDFRYPPVSPNAVSHMLHTE